MVSRQVSVADTKAVVFEVADEEARHLLDKFCTLCPNVEEDDLSPEEP